MTDTATITKTALVGAKERKQAATHEEAHQFAIGTATRKCQSICEDRSK